ncbi:MAG: twin-arginine translocase TatA/TatE family subunit [Actinobacteria bacterium]|nr:twin-arginine translocase TatA/TatE family subunit [Actinomycetota bacterium]
MNFALIPGLPTVGGPELIIVLVIILLLFGAKRIPELAKGLGSGIREFKKGTSGQDEKEELKDEKKGEELPGGGEDAHNARMREEAASEERPGEPAEQTAKRAEQNL